MASSASRRTPDLHHPDLWVDTSDTLEPAYLQDTRDYELAFDAWLNAVSTEPNSSSAHTNWTLSSTSANAFLPTQELSPAPMVGTHVHDKAFVQPALTDPGVDMRLLGFQAQLGRDKMSTSSWDTDCSQDENWQQLACSECLRDFANLSALDRHTQSTLHKAWRCFEAGCGKTYARRDTFLRHRTTHRDDALSHVCLACSKIKKRKVFKRKDHLRDHMRKCHPKVADSRRQVFLLLVHSNFMLIILQGKS